MEHEKIAKLIKQIRKENNLTQKQLAEKYNVTYQAVSKWENGLNLPDTYLLKQMSKDFKISMDDIFEGTYSKNKQKSKKKIISIAFIVLLIITLIICIMFLLKYTLNKNEDFNFKTLSSNCENFNISGNIAYNDTKTSIYITNIRYCGGNDTNKYNKIECNLYESTEKYEKKISTYSYTGKEKITLEEFLQTVTITVDDYKKTCKEYSENSLYLSVEAKNNNDITTYKIPLILERNCQN